MDLIKVEKAVADFAVAGVGGDNPRRWLMCSSPPSWVVELPSLYFWARSIARSRAEAVSNWTRSILSLALRILFGPPKRCARFIVVIGLFPCRLDPDPANDTHRSGLSRGAGATGAPAPRWLPSANRRTCVIWPARELSVSAVPALAWAFSRQRQSRRERSLSNTKAAS